MANPKLPGIPEAEQALLYAKLNEYNRGRMSYKEAGAYFVVLPRPGHPTYSVWVYSPHLKRADFCLSTSFPPTSTNHYGWQVRCFSSPDAVC